MESAMNSRYCRLKWTTTLIVSVLGAAPLHADNTLVVMSGERPPYVGAALPEGGYVPELLNAVFQRSGYQVKLQFSTWARAKVQTAQGEAAAMIASDCQDGGAPDFVYSNRFFGGTTGLLKNRSLALLYSAADLQRPATLFKSMAHLRFGAVPDGVSFPAFEQAANLNKEWPVSDLKNLDLLDQGRIQLALIDKYAAADLMVSQRPHLIGQLEFMTPPLAQSEFCLAFPTRLKHHAQLRDAFNAGLAQSRRDGTLERIMNRHGLFPARRARTGKVQLIVGTVNNADMIVMQRLAKQFETRHPHIELVWRVLDENTLRMRLISDLAIADGQFDVMTIGTYELPIWAQRGWIAPIKDLPAQYALDDLLPTVRRHLSHEGQLYALPFYAESAMTYYRKDLFAKAGISMPVHPRYADIAAFAAKLHKPAQGVYGICLRGKPGWGENMALIGTLMRAHGGNWFDQQGRPELSSPVWNASVTLYANLLGKYGPPDADRNGFNENLALFSQGRCAIWIDATVAAGMLFDARRSKVAGQLGFAAAPVAAANPGGAWLWSWALAIPRSSQHRAEAQQFIAWATSPHYIALVAQQYGWVAVPPGTRQSTYTNPHYRKAAPFASFVLEALDPVGPNGSTRQLSAGQYVSIPQFQAIGDRTGQEIAKVLRREQSVDIALKRAQNFALEQMQNAGQR
jgi:sorbitol/mannitol transport system substrate-binding protein